MGEDISLRVMGDELGVKASADYMEEKGRIGSARLLREYLTNPDRGFSNRDGDGYGYGYGDGNGDGDGYGCG